MLVKTSNLTGSTLDLAVAAALYGYTADGLNYRYSSDWAHAGPIIEREKIELRYYHVIVAGIWYRDGIGSNECSYKQIGPTSLIAAMRCFVASKFGDEVEIPVELL